MTCFKLQLSEVRQVSLSSTHATLRNLVSVPQIFLEAVNSCSNPPGELARTAGPETKGSVKLPPKDAQSTPLTRTERAGLSFDLTVVGSRVSAGRMSSQILLASEQNSNVPVSQLFTRGELVGADHQPLRPHPLKPLTRAPRQARARTAACTRACTTRPASVRSSSLCGRGGRLTRALAVVALKVIDLDTEDDDISEIQKEVAILSEMRDAARHNITLYHGCYLNGSELWIAMDFASGGSIRTLVRCQGSRTVRSQR